MTAIPSPATPVPDAFSGLGGVAFLTDKEPKPGEVKQPKITQEISGSPRVLDVIAQLLIFLN